MTIAEIAAWYAATVSTTVLVWDVIKWSRTGPRINAVAYAGWESYGIPETDGQTLLFVKLTNVGDRATTLTSWGMYWYPKSGRLIAKNRLKSFVVPGGLAGLGEIPKKLDPGDVWTGVARETPDYNEARKAGRVVIALGFSHQEKEIQIELNSSAPVATKTNSI